MSFIQKVATERVNGDVDLQKDQLQYTATYLAKPLLTQCLHGNTNSHLSFRRLHSAPMLLEFSMHPFYVAGKLVCGGGDGTTCKVHTRERFLPARGFRSC